MDSLNSMSFKIHFLQFQILRFYQEAARTLQAGVEFLDQQHGVDIDIPALQTFLEGMRNKLILEPDRSLQLSSLDRYKLSRQLEHKVIQLIRKYWKKRSGEKDVRKWSSEILTALRQFDVFRAFELAQRYASENRDNEFAKHVEKSIRDGVLQCASSEEGQKKHMWLMEKIELVDPSRLLKILHPIIFWACSRLGLLFFGLLLVFDVAVYVKHKDFWMYGYMENIALIVNQWFVMFVISIASSIVHEMGHAIACYRFGGQVRSFGIILIAGMFPVPFADVTDSYFMPRQRRIVIALGGVIAQLLLGSIGILFWLATEPGTTANMYATLFVLSNTFLAGFNLLPLQKADGYYILVDITGIENLYFRALQYCTPRIRKLVWGDQEIAEEGEMPSRKVRIVLWSYWCFGIAFRVLGIAISFLLLPIFWSSMHIVVKVLAFILLARIALWGIGAFMSRLWSLPAAISGYKRNLSWSSFSRFRRLAFVGAILGGLFLFPWPYEIRAPAQIITEKISPVIVPAGGVIRSIPIEEGREVSKGDVLLSVWSSSAEATRDQKGQLDDSSREYELTSPSDGVVIFGDAKPFQGRSVRSGEVLLEVWSKNSLFSSRISESVLGSLSQGALIKFRSAIAESPTILGQVRHIAPIARSSPGLRNLQRHGFPPESILRVEGSFNEQLPEYVRFGSSGAVAIDAGWKPLGYVLFRKLWNHLNMSLWMTV